MQCAAVNTFIEIEQVETSLSPARRAALGLGPVGVDLRDACIRVSVIERFSNSDVRCIQVFDHPYVSTTTSNRQLVDAVLAVAKTHVDAALNARLVEDLRGAQFRT